MKLKEIEIHNFKSIENLKIEIDDFLVIIGENNTGKSSILKGLELFYSESIKNINEEIFYFKDTKKPVEIILTFNKLSEEEKEQKYIKHWIFSDEVKIKRVVYIDPVSNKPKSIFYGWQQKPLDFHFDLSRFDEYKNNIEKIVIEKNLPDYFKSASNKVTQASYKEGVKIHKEKGLVEMGAPDWIENPGGLSENFSSLLPRFYLVPAVKDAQDESKITQSTTLGKLINDLTNRIVTTNAKFEEVTEQINGLKKFLNKSEDGSDSNRLAEIIELETTLSNIISESMPESKVEIEIVTPELVDLFKGTNITLNDSISTSIDNKGHGLQRALIFAYIRAYAKFINEIKVGDELKRRNFILAIEEPELFLHPNGQRKMMNVLKEIAHNDQVIMCSHSSFFVDMFQYPKIVIVKRDGYRPSYSVQYTGNIFEDEEQKKSYRYLSFFDISRSELFFARKVILVEGPTEKQIIPFWAEKLSESDNKFDFSANNICVTDCGGKTNLSVFMKVCNNLKIPYIVIHDIDPIDFAEDKADKTDNEKSRLRIFKENDKIESLLAEDFGYIIKINPDLENVIGVSSSQAEKHGKVSATYNKFETVNPEQYPENVKTLMNLLVEWKHNKRIYEIS